MLIEDDLNGVDTLKLDLGGKFECTRGSVIAGFEFLQVIHRTDSVERGIRRSRR